MNPLALSVQEEIQLIAEQFRRCFSPTELEQRAREIGFVQRKRKMKAQDFVSLCVFQKENIITNTLSHLCSVLDNSTKVSMSTEGLNQRFNLLGSTFLQSLFSSLLLDKIITAASLPCSYVDFTRIRIMDSTVFQLPDDYLAYYEGCGGSANESGLKIQLEYELKSGEFLFLDIGDGKNSDNIAGALRAATVEVNDLCIRDLGYFCLDDFNEISERRAFYLSRLKTSMNVYIKSDPDKIEYLMDGRIKKSSLYTQIDLEERMESLSPGEVMEFPQVYIGQQKKLCTRLILYKLTEEQLKKRQLMRLKNEKKRMTEYSERTKRLDEINVFITNAPEESLPKEQVFPMYSLRWQIEILFKIWKSVFEIDSLKPVKIERFHCHLYGKLITLMLCSSLMFKIRELLLRKKKMEMSELKSMRILKQYLESFYQSLEQEQMEGIHDVLMQMILMIAKNGKKSHRYDKKTVFDILKVVYKYAEKGGLVA